MRDWLKKEWKIVIVLFLLSIPESLPLIKPGFYEPHDLHHLADIYQMYRGFETGQFPPRWAPDFLYGYGYPLFNFYYVLPFYLGAVFFAIGFALTISFKLVFLTSVLISILGMYLFLREFFGKWESVAGSVLFLYTPYRAVEIYVRGAMGEALALSILPYVLWILVKLVKKPSLKLVSLTSIIFTLFILAHNYLWFLSLPYIGLLILLIIWSGKNKKQILSYLTFSGLLSLGLAAYWLVPALLERSLVDRLTPFIIEDHFPFIKQLIIPSWGYGSSVWGPGDELSFQVGVMNWVFFLTFLALFIFLRKRIKDKQLLNIGIWIAVGMVVTLFMMNIRSMFIWKLIPFYNFIQFPWRLLIFTTLLSSVATAYVADLLKYIKFRKFGTFRIWGVFVIVGCSLLLTYGYFRPSQVFYKTDDKYFSRFFANRTVEGEKDRASQEYLQWSEDYLLLPNWSDEKPDSLPESRIGVTEGEGIINKLSKDSRMKYEVEVEANTPMTLTFHTLYFPGWFAEVDGSLAQINPGKPYGQIEMEIPEGKHTLKIFWKETDLRKFANCITLISVLLVVLLFKIKKISRMKLN